MALLAAACSDDAPTSGIGGITLPPCTVPLPQGTAKPFTTPPPTTTVPTAATAAAVGGTQPSDTATSTPTTPPTSTTTTTVLVPAICDLSAVVTDIGQAEPGYAFSDLHCSRDWATVVAKAFNPGVSRDELVVLHADAGRWSVVEGGGATTCTSARVPEEQRVPLDCARWES